MKRAEYDEEVRKDDINFWKTTNDEAKPTAVNKSLQSQNVSGRPNWQASLPNVADQGDRELKVDSSFQPLQRDNTYNMWLNHAEELDFYKQPAHNPHMRKQSSPNKEAQHQQAGYSPLTIGKKKPAGK